ncbi:protein activator of alkane oxidation PraB [Glycocaulis profundi]|nr:protein activator of alkane oxidation PraB [Glycocaulis profundi]
MLKIATSASAVALMAAVIATPAALADTPFTGTGVLELAQTIDVECRITVNGVAHSDGSVTVDDVSFTPGNVLCGIAIFDDGPWDIEDNPGPTSITLYVTAATFVGGNCSGWITVPYDSSTGELTFNNVSVPGSPAPCTINDGSEKFTLTPPI